jgi:serine/threonine protein kinase
MTAATAGFVETLRTLPLLTPEQRGQLPSLLQQLPDVKSLGQELIRRGWLTPFQANQLARGKGKELVLDQYVLLELLGEGGMGSVFKARQQRMDRLVALKAIRREALKAPGAVERFQREARTAAMLSHPNVVTVFDSSTGGGGHYLVMEYIEGTDLARVVKTQGALPVAAACEYIRQAALGLQHAHERGLVHRDIKPHNLMLTKKGIVKVMDLGLARTVQGATSEAVTEGISVTGNVLGTPDYMAPEQGLNSKKVDIRADIYSLGCTLYYLLTGQVPFPGETVTEKLIKHQLEEPPSIETVRADLPKGLAKVVQTMMAKKPEKRYQTPAEAAAALLPFAQMSGPASVLFTQSVAAAPGLQLDSMTAVATAEPVEPRRSRLRYKLFAGLAAVLLLGLVLVFTGMFSSARNASNAGVSPSSRDTASSVAVRDSAPGTSSAAKSAFLDLGNGVKLDLVPIKKGMFEMGSPKSDTDADAAEKPPHSVEITRDFQIGKYPVTQEQYKQVIGQEPSFHSPRGGGKAQVGNQDTRRFPVEMVSWDDAQRFCDVASRLAKRRVELPTEAEWEYACRAGTTTRYYSGFFLTDKDANFVSQLGRPSAVGSYPANAWGLHDMAGNVWQWCADPMRSYAGGGGRDPRGAKDDGGRILRGGSFNSSAKECRSAHRFNLGTNTPSINIGFRVVVRPD